MEKEKSQIADPDNYARWLDSEENPIGFIITPENSPTLKLLRQLRKDGY